LTILDIEAGRAHSSLMVQGFKVFEVQNSTIRYE